MPAILLVAVIVGFALPTLAPCHSPDPANCARKIIGDSQQSQQMSSSFSTIDLSIVGASMNDNGTLRALEGFNGFVNFRFEGINGHPEQDDPVEVTITISDGTPEVTWSDPLTRTFTFDPSGDAHDERFDFTVAADAPVGPATIGFEVVAGASEFAEELWFEVVADVAASSTSFDDGPLVWTGALVAAAGALALVAGRCSPRPRVPRAMALALVVLAVPLAGCVDAPDAGKQDLDDGGDDDEGDDPLPYNDGGDELQNDAVYLVADVVIEGGTLKNDGKRLAEPAQAGYFNFNVTALEGLGHSGDALTIEISFDAVTGIDWVGNDTKTVTVESDGAARQDVFFLFYVEDDPSLTRVVADFTVILDGETQDGTLTFDVA